MIGLPCISSSGEKSVVDVPFPSVNVSVSTSLSTSLETGGSVWHAGMAMAHFLHSNRHLVEGKVVVELGAGCGLCGLLAGLLGAKLVILTDIPEGGELLQRNIDLNKNQTSCEYCVVPLMFGESIDCLNNRLSEVLGQDKHGNMSIDVVLASDVGYDVSIQEPFATTLKSLLHSNCANTSSSIGLLAEEVRWRDIYGWYLETLLEPSETTEDGQDDLSLVKLHHLDDETVSQCYSNQRDLVEQKVLMESDSHKQRGGILHDRGVVSETVGKSSVCPIEILVIGTPSHCPDITLII